MKNILKLCLIFAGAAFVATPLVLAQNEQRPPARQGGGGGRGLNAQTLTEQLGLSAAQTAKVEAIIKKQQADMQAVPQAERREKGRAIREEVTKSINAVLTAEQQKKWAEIQANAPQGGGRQGGGQGGQGGAGARRQPGNEN